MPKRTRNTPAKRPAMTPIPSSPKRQKSGLYVLLGGVIVIGVALFLAFYKPPPAGTAGTPPSGNDPRLVADKGQVDLGDMKLGATADVSFKLTNTGSAPLQFKEAPYIEVKEGC